MRKLFKIILLFNFITTLFTPFSISAWMLPVSTEKLSQFSTAIVVATPTKVYPFLTNLDQGAWRIDTKIEFRIEEVFKGNDVRIMEIVLPGGTVGEKTMRLEHVPKFVEGQKVIIFFRETEQGFLPLYGEAGVFSLKDDYVEKEGLSKSEFIKKINNFINKSNIQFQNQISSQEAKNWWSGCSLRK